jgi:hypothetical protein
MSARPWAAGLSLALAVAPATRTLVALIERAKHPEADPASVVWAAFVDRALVTAYLTVALAVALTALSRRVRALRDDRSFAAALAVGALGALAGMFA